MQIASAKIKSMYIMHKNSLISCMLVIAMDTYAVDITIGRKEICIEFPGTYVNIYRDFLLTALMVNSTD